MRSILIKKKNLLHFGLRHVKISPKQINEQQVQIPYGPENFFQVLLTTTRFSSVS